MSSEHDREIVAFLEGYGATNIGWQQGGKHKVLTFEFREKQFKYPMSRGSGPMDPRVNMNAIAELKRKLGAPVEDIAREPRRLETMMPAPSFEGKPMVQPNAISQNGKLGYYSSNRQYIFSFPNEIADAIKSWPAIEAVLLPSGDFELSRKSGQSPKMGFKKSEGYVLQLYRNGVVHEPFGRSPAEYLYCDGKVLVHCPRATRVPVNQARSTASKRVAETKRVVHQEPKPAQAEPVAEPTPVPVKVPETLAERVLAVYPTVFSPASSAKIDPAAVLALVRRVEAETVYRLVKVKTPEAPDGKWSFVAPRIE